MKLNYKLEHNDFLQQQLFEVSKSERIMKKKNRSWVFLTLACVILALVFYFKHNTPIVIYFGVFAVLIGLFYPKYFKWRYERHYNKSIKDIYSKLIGEELELEITENLIKTKNKVGEEEVNLNEVEEIYSLSEHFLLKATTGAVLIIPKLKIEKPEEVELLFKQYGKEVHDETKWKW